MFWWIASFSLHDPKHTEGDWETASIWSGRVQLALFAVGVGCLIPYFRKRHPLVMILLGLAMLIHFVVLYVFNICLYLDLGGPFP